MLGLLIGIPVLLGVKNKEKLLMATVIFFLPLNPELHLIKPPNFEELSYYNGANRLLLYFTDLPLLVLLAWMLIKKSKNNHMSRRSYNKKSLIFPLILWMCVSIMSLISATMPRLTLFELIRMGRMLAYFFVFLHYIKKKSDVNFVMKCFIFSMLFQSFLIFTQFATNSLVISSIGLNEEMDIVAGVFRPQGTLPHSSHFAKWSGILLPICFCFALFTKRKIDQTIGFICLFTGIVALILTISRAGLISLIFSLTFIVIYLAREKMLKLRRMGLYVLLICIISIPIGQTVTKRMLHRILNDELSAWSRIPMYKVAINVIKANPIIGVGLSNYTIVAPKYDKTECQISKWFPWPVHNLYLFYAAEIGIFGLFFFLWFFWRLIKASFICAKFSIGTYYKAIYLGIAVGIIAILIQNLTGWGFRGHMIHMCTIAILGASVENEKFRLDLNSKKKPSL